MEDTNAVEISTDSYNWITSPVTTYNGPIEKLRCFIPEFERRKFGPSLLPLGDQDTGCLFDDTPGVNRFHDAIVRLPINDSKVEIPVGIVSKQYTLVQHQQLFDKVLQALDNMEINCADVKASLDLTEYGERMRLSVVLPHDKYGMKLAVNDEYGFKFECFNSVDGSMRLRAVISWLRLICLNGMTIRIDDTSYERRHNKYMKISDIEYILHEGIASSAKEREVYQRWRRQKVPLDKLAKWTDNYLAKKWGVKAATRTWHIAKSGFDVTFADPFEKATPTSKTVVMGGKVTGAILPGDTVYAISQVLSWLAKERQDVQEQLEWREQIPELLKPLTV